MNVLQITFHVFRQSVTRVGETDHQLANGNSNELVEKHQQLRPEENIPFNLSMVKVLPKISYGGKHVCPTVGQRMDLTIGRLYHAVKLVILHFLFVSNPNTDQLSCYGSIIHKGRTPNKIFYHTVEN